MRPLPSPLAALLPVLVLSGCALHQPMSELAALHANPYYPNALPWAGGASATVGYMDRQKLLDQWRRHLEPDRARATRFYNPYLTSFGVYHAFLGRKAGVSVTTGFGTCGLDATLNLGGRNYLTGSYSGLGGGQVILQRRVVERAALTVLAGAAMRREVYYVRVPDNEDLFGVPYEQNRVTMLGLRSMVAVHRKPPGWPVGAILTGFAGYEPRLRQPAVALTVAFGWFRSARSQPTGR